MDNEINLASSTQNYGAAISPLSEMARRVDALPSHDREGRIFWKLRLTSFRAHLNYLRSHSRLRTGLVVFLSLFFWLGLFVLFYGGFDFVISHVGASGETYHVEVVQFVFTLFFASLQMMLLFSSGIILYGGLYSSSETNFLLALPVREERLVFYRFQEALFFSSWGFFLLASPLMLSYGLVASAPWHYYAFLPVLLLASAYIPCALGAIVCLLLIRQLPKLRRLLLGGAALAVSVVAYQSIWKTLEVANIEMLGAVWFKETFHRFGFARGEWLPSTWLSNSLLDAARSPTLDPADMPGLEAGKYLLVILSNALLLHVLVQWIGKKVFRESYWNLFSQRARKISVKAMWIDRLADRLMFVFPKQTRLLIVKDLRQFRRDPVQWSQFLIFFGLLLLYFANVDRFRQNRTDLSALTWVNVVSFLNLAVVGLILSTFTTRFIYPLISLEGRRFWILGRLAVDRDTILWGKFFFAAGGSWLPCVALVLISDLMLKVSMMVVVVHQLVCLLLCLGLSGMAVGLGATLPNFQEQSPSKIAAGFGGTLNLVLSAIFIMAVVLLTALPCHFFLLAGNTDLEAKWLQPHYLRLWLGLGVGISLLLGILVTAIPMRFGLRAFRRMEN